LPPSSGSKNKPSKKPALKQAKRIKPGSFVKFRSMALLAICFHAGFLLGSFFDPEDGGDMFL
jgi:hypothetical protein